MTASTNDPRRAIGRRLLGNTSVTMFYRMAILEQTLTALREAGYHLAQADASRWLSVKDMHWDLSRVLHFPEYYGENFDAFNDCLRDVACREYGFPEDATGIVLVLTGYDEFAREFPEHAHDLVDVFAIRSRNAMLSGEQLICLIQSDDPSFSLPPVGATP